MAKGLTKKERLFINRYLQGESGTKAAIAAGYARKSAAVTASKLLKKAKVQDEIARKQGPAMAKLEAATDAALAANAVTAENILTHLAQMGLAHARLAKFLKVNGADLEYDFTNATPEDLQIIAPMIAETRSEFYTEGSGEKAREVKRVTLKFVDRKAVLELLGRWHKLKLWSDRVEIGGIFTTEMTNEELLTYAATGKLPDRFKDRLKKGGASEWTM